MSYGGQQALIAQQQMSFAIITSLVGSCFRDCGLNYNSGEFDNTERTCLTNCASRYAQGSKLISEVNQEMASKYQGGAFQ